MSVLRRKCPKKLTIVDGKKTKKNKDVRTSQSCDHVHLGTSAIQVNERDTGEQAKNVEIHNISREKAYFCLLIIKN